MTIETSVKALSAYDVPNAQATAYTVGSTVLRFRIDHAVVVNYTSNPRTFTLYILQSGDAVANIRKRYDAINIPANETVSLFDIVGDILETGGIINCFADAASALALTVGGTNFK